MFTNESENVGFSLIHFLRRRLDESMARDDQVSECCDVQRKVVVGRLKPLETKFGFKYHYLSKIF